MDEIRDAEYFSEQDLQLRARLQPARNVRTITPRVCGSCAYGRTEEGTFFCVRRDGFDCDVGDMMQWFRTCDFWKG